MCSQIPDAACIYYYFGNWTFCACINNILCTLYLILSGILQGFVLGPTQFNILFNDILRIVRNFIALCEDDTAIYSFAHHLFYLYKTLQNHIDNESETAAVYFYKTLTYPNHITINNVTIPWTGRSKYLGSS